MYGKWFIGFVEAVAARINANSTINCNQYGSRMEQSNTGHRSEHEQESYYVDDERQWDQCSPKEYPRSMSFEPTSRLLQNERRKNGCFLLGDDAAEEGYYD